LLKKLYRIFNKFWGILTTTNWHVMTWGRNDLRRIDLGAKRLGANRLGGETTGYLSNKLFLNCKVFPWQLAHKANEKVFWETKFITFFIYFPSHFFVPLPASSFLQEFCLPVSGCGIGHIKSFMPVKNACKSNNMLQLL
jgi:hypothetical protein